MMKLTKKSIHQYGDILNASELAAFLNIGLNKTYQILGRHEIRARRIGQRKWLIPKQAVIEYISAPCYNDNNDTEGSDRQKGGK